MKHMSEAHKKAKMGILEQLKGDMMGMMGDDLKSAQKATVIAKDKKGLLAGLEKAQEVVEDHEMGPAKEDENAESVMGDMADRSEEDELSDMSPEELAAMKAKIEELLQKRRA